MMKRRETKWNGTLRKSMYQSLEDPKDLVVWCDDFRQTNPPTEGWFSCEMKHPLAGFKSKNVLMTLDLDPVDKNGKVIEEPDINIPYPNWEVEDFRYSLDEGYDELTDREKNMVEFISHLLRGRKAEVFKTSENGQTRIAVDLNSSVIEFY